MAKLLKSIKEIWKANKWEYLISGIVVTMGCLFFYTKSHLQLEYTIPLGWLGLTFFMFGFGLFLGGDE